MECNRLLQYEIEAFTFVVIMAFLNWMHNWIQFVTNNELVLCFLLQFDRMPTRLGLFYVEKLGSTFTVVYIHIFV